MRNIIALFLLISISLHAQHKFIAGDTATKEIFIVDKNGVKTWSYKAPGKPQDISILPNGHILVCCQTIVFELNREKQIVWEFKRKGEMHSAQRLKDGNTIIGHTSKGKVYLVSPEAKILQEFQTTYKTKNTHRIFRRIRQANDGKVYVAHHGDGVCRIYSPKGKVTGMVTHYADRCFSATPISEHRILLTGEKKIKIVNHQDQVLWEVDVSEIRGHKVHSLTSAKLLKNGNILVANWQGHIKKKGRTQPAMIEINPDKKVVWTYDGDKNKCLITMDVFE